MLKYWIWLSTREGVSNVQALSLLSRLGSAAAIYQADEDALKDADGRSVPASLLDKSLTGAEIILQQCYQKNIHVMTIQDAQYPARLRVISDPPIVLYYKGVFPAIDTSPVIAMVGTRKASAYGLMQAKRLGYQVAKSGGIVVSGGADGIDTMCLTGALTADRPVIAVLGCGVDVVYPAGNRVLFEDIAAHGCLLSEYPPQTPALGSHFPVRNRIISALSLGVVVVEAPKRSGALITANRALEQGRDVFTVPGNVGKYSASARGRDRRRRRLGHYERVCPFVSGARVPSAENHPHAADPGAARKRCKIHGQASAETEKDAEKRNFARALRHKSH